MAKKIDISKVVSNNLCFSCGACNICPVEAISFEITPVGRNLPRINHEICTNCSVCYDVCPGLDSKRIVFSLLDGINDPFIGDILNAYVGKSNNQKIFRNSQSGGLVTESLTYLFDKDLITHALVVRMNPGNPPMPQYFFATSPKDLFVSQRSIYAPINLLSAFKEIKKIDGKIAIVGLPCHLEGVKCLFHKNPKIHSIIKYKLGLICDGVLAYSAIDIFSRGERIKPYYIVYRNKNIKNYLRAPVTILDDSGKVVKIIPQSERFLLKELITPPRCLICFNKMNLFADIVYGDPWGIKGADMQNGESLVIVRNEVGQEIIDGLIKEGRALLRKIDHREALEGQKINEKRINWFSAFKAYTELGFEVPEYFAKIEKVIPSYSQKKRINYYKTRIKDFLDLETKNSRSEVIRCLSRKIIYKKLQSKLKNLLIKIIFYQHWRKR